ncbi:MAG: hypothetical protein WBA43_13075 [Elainellaceae cyanobacterium]
MEGGMAAGSAGGAILEPVVSWQWLFLGTAIAAALVLWQLRRYGSLFDAPKITTFPSLQTVFAGYRAVLSNFRGARTYAYVLWNGIYHSGVYRTHLGSRTDLESADWQGS